MNLVIDIGNTFAKLAVFEDNIIIHHQIMTAINSEKIIKITSKYSIKKAIISSVAQNKTEIQSFFSQKHIDTLLFSSSTSLPIQINYKTPTTLGVDRIAAVVGASVLHPNEDVLVIDMGTCVTYDCISKEKHYFGGSISLGLSMRLKALHHFTKRLPLIEFKNNFISFVGDSTENSILSGVFYGLKLEMEGVIHTYLKQYPQLKIVVTGGDLKFFDLEPKNRIFADEFLVLKGLNEILNYNEQI